MPTLLTTPRMSPELRARIEQSLHSDARSRVGGASPLQGARLIRILTALGVVALSISLFVTFRKSRREFSATHQTLTAEFKKRAAPISDDYQRRLRFIDDLLKKANDPYAGDVFSEVLSPGADAIVKLLAEPFVYVRGPIGSFERSKNRQETWGDGGPDALIRCLLVPPTDIKESTILRHLGHIYQPSTFQNRFVNLDDAYGAVAFLQSDFKTRLGTTSRMRELSSLQAELERSPLTTGAPFREVRYFFFVFDEPKPIGVPSDFDGEAEHFLRAGLVDLKSGEPLLRVRRHVDPDWISEKGRLSYSRPLDSCRLAFEIRQELDAP